ncbi:unnamed protein product [Hydatigera taeniaeformis]|uniref:Isopentenyl phosphate kinase n=1 Tax=Hydatigena taeniaeformis TaxID=6205 RepID=A0A0R3WLA5_HYDTA|nr:unnamed protein product [Hydatigera taeniaeformis]
MEADYEFGRRIIIIHGGDGLCSASTQALMTMSARSKSRLHYPCHNGRIGQQMAKGVDQLAMPSSTKSRPTDDTLFSRVVTNAVQLFVLNVPKV